MNATFVPVHGSVLSPLLGRSVVPYEVGNVLHWLEPDRDAAVCGYRPAWWARLNENPGGDLIDCALCHARAFGGADWRELHAFEGDDS